LQIKTQNAELYLKGATVDCLRLAAACGRIVQTSVKVAKTRLLPLVPTRVSLVPSATRLKLSLWSSSGRAKKFEFCHWLTRKECAAGMKITKLYAFYFTFGPVDSSRLYENRRFHVLTKCKEVGRLQRCHSRS